MEPAQSSLDHPSNSWLQKAENGSLPDTLIRYGICKVLHELASKDLMPGGSKYTTIEEFIKKEMRTCDEIVSDVHKPNEQQYMIPPEFFEIFLGDYVKYSCGYWMELEFYEVSESPSTSFLRDVITGTSGMVTEFEKHKSIRQLLTKAEYDMLRVTLARAEVREKQCVLELGCGWGAAAFHILENYTQTKVVAVTNSHAQGEYILKKALEKKVNDRLLVLVCNVAEFDLARYGKQVEKFIGKKKFDRIFSIGMLEHVRNWEKLLNRLTEEWLEENGKIFIDFLAHKSQAYTYDSNTWMGKYFFTGGMMPSHTLPKFLDLTIGKTLEIEAEYRVNGRHFSKTVEAWLKLFYQNKARISKLLEQIYGKENAKVWYNRWRIYLLTLSEFFRMREGTEWTVSQYLFKRWKPSEPAAGSQETTENK